MFSSVRRFGEIIGLLSLQKPVQLAHGEQPITDIDRLEPVSGVRRATESLSLASAAGAAACGTLMALTPPGAIVAAGAGIAAVSTGLFWAVRRYIVSRSEANLKNCMSRYDDLRTDITAANAQGLTQLRNELREYRKMFQDAGFEDLYLSLKVLALHHQVHCYEHELAGGLQAACVNGSVPTSHVAMQLLAALDDYRQRRSRPARREFINAENALTLPLSTADYANLKEAASSLLLNKDVFEQCGLTRRYFNVRARILSRMVKILEARAFTLTDPVARAAALDTINDEDQDINF